MRKDILERRDEIELWISQLQPKAKICFELNCRPSTLNSYLRKLGLSYKGTVGGKGKTSPYRKAATEFLYKGSTISSHKLKLKLLRDNIKKKICERCKGEEWLGETIPLELHHINGNRFDNSLSNLQLLCPNCHALTDNYSGRKSQIN
ncbi:hypothetical protein BH18ACI1_BH18ACI1_19180 [soil metagenome]